MGVGWLIPVLNLLAMGGGPVTAAADENRPVCGTLAVAPLVNGTLAVASLVGGTLAVSSVVGGTLEVEDC